MYIELTREGRKMKEMSRKEKFNILQIFQNDDSELEVNSGIGYFGIFPKSCKSNSFLRAVQLLQPNLFSVEI